MLDYLTLHVVVTPGTYNALQQLSYASVVFLLAPFSMATGVAMSPAIAARFPWYIKIFHGRQGDRSLHFLALCGFIAFFIGHVALVVLHGFPKGLAVIVLGETHDPHLTRALVVKVAALLLGFAELTALSAASQLTGAGHVAEWIRQVGVYLVVNVLPYAAPFIVALSLHRELRN